MKRFLPVVAVALGMTLFGSGPASASALCPGDDVVPTLQTGAVAAGALMCDLNAVRVKSGLHPLGWNWQLWWSAQQLANDMVANHFFSHTDSSGRGLLDRARDAGYLTNAADWLVLENNAWGQKGAYATPLSTVLGWLQSDEHRQQMLNPDLREVGIGMNEGSPTTGGADGFFYVVDFGARALAAPTPPGRQSGQTAGRPHAKRHTRCHAKSHRCRRATHAHAVSG